jgi:hypothetical protein
MNIRMSLKDEKSMQQTNKASNKKNISQCNTKTTLLLLLLLLLLFLSSILIKFSSFFLSFFLSFLSPHLPTTLFLYAQASLNVFACAALPKNHTPTTDTSNTTDTKK